MATEKKEFKFSLPKYVYGQVYKAYLVSGKKKVFNVHNIKAQTWYYVLNKLKKEGKIKDFEIGDTEATAFDVIVKGFNSKDLWYEKYIAAIEQNLKEEKAIA